MFLVRRPGGLWELRESSLTAGGPRARTLATFRECSEETVARVAERRAGGVEAHALRALCRRAGAPVARPVPDRAAASLLASLARGEAARPVLQRVLAAALGTPGASASDSERAAARWVAATPEERGRTLRELLLLADRLPAPGRGALGFPPVPRPA